MSDQKRNFTPPQREKNIFDNNNLTLKAPCPTPSGQGQTSALRLIITNGNPRLMIYTNDPADKDNNYGRIEVRMTPMVMLDIAEAITTASTSPEGTKFTAQVENFIGNPPRKEVSHTVTVGKNKEGVVFIVVRDALNGSRPVIPFQFLGGNTHQFVGPGGEPLDPRTVSPITARAWARLFTTAGMQLCTTTWREPQKQNQGGNRQGGGGGNWNNNRQGGGGGGGNWNNNRQGGNQGGGWNNNQGGGQQSAPSMDVNLDDDIPF